ncbi:NADPH-dependent FMN reductase [Pigmentiphaga sp.]|jgi:Predicted flavoprotein|uniref:NADPH-dependent FMN reductase n=1 Tax=Pigmentiphaga sp. TaxID=1977564 RepID=UPI0025D6EB51|nr:NADPH-dependent FMN reductase [Pigmentiphaga sp.]MBX6317808.1 NAD(P)H-dependent oxidoreductase [Pigmentiphaga sp.]
MSTIKIGMIVGSLRKDSINRQLAKAVAKRLPAHMQTEDIPIGELPLYNQDLDAAMPAPVLAFKQRVESVQALLFFTPEYNRSYSGVLKNAIDWASRPSGKNSWARKPAGILGTSPSQIGTALAQEHLRMVLSALDVAVLPQPSIFVQYTEGLIDAEGRITNEITAKFIQGFVDRYVAWVEKLAPAAS